MFKIFFKNSTVILFIAVLFFSCKTDIKKINELDIKHLPSQKAKNITILRTDSTIIKAEIFAPEVEHFFSLKNPYTNFPKGLEATSYKKYPVIETSLSCQKAKHLINEQLWIVENKVVVINDIGYKLETELLYWDEEKRSIYTEKDVRITTENEIIWGKGLTADQDFKDYEIIEPVGSIYIDE